MGIIFNVDSPNVNDEAISFNQESDFPEVRGTKAPPPEIPVFVDLYFYIGYTMNTTQTTSFLTGVSSPGAPVSFLLQDELINDYMIESPMAGSPMVLVAFLSGAGSVNVKIRDGLGGITVGEITFGPFSFGAVPQQQTIVIPFSSGINYTFSSGHYIEAFFNFTGDARIHFGSTTQPSRLELYGSTVTDITVKTENFHGIPTDRFYPNDIDIPQERKKVGINGLVTEVFGKQGEIQYIDYVQVQIQGPGYDQTRNAYYDKTNYEYNYTWNYFFGQSSGAYTITVHVFDEQNNEFTVTGTIYMSQYGVLLTSPSQDPVEGYYQAEARRNIKRNSTVTYIINVWNIGNSETGINITTFGSIGWDWWLEGSNLTNNNNSKTDSILSVQPGEKKSIKLVVHSKDMPLGDVGTILVIAACSDDPGEESILTTITRVVIGFQIPEGWNLISIPSIQSDPNIVSVLSSNDGDYDAVQWFDVSDASDPWKHKHVSKLPQLNDLTDIYHTMGFWIHITEPGGTFFGYTGTPPSSNQTIHLYKGWNLVGYPSETSYNRTNGLNNLTYDSQVDAVQWFNGTSKTWHFMGPDDLFVPGRGYWVHAKADCEWEVPL
jgi:hypothetical protein